jgi:hypothetical protein
MCLYLEGFLFILLRVKEREKEKEVGQVAREVQWVGF